MHPVRKPYPANARDLPQSVFFFFMRQIMVFIPGTQRRGNSAQGSKPTGCICVEEGIPRGRFYSRIFLQGDSDGENINWNYAGKAGLALPGQRLYQQVKHIPRQDFWPECFLSTGLSENFPAVIVRESGILKNGFFLISTLIRRKSTDHYPLKLWKR
jgi:hypothetical protein